MRDVSIYFPWRIAEGGYRWIETRARDPSHPNDAAVQLYLTDCRPIGSAGHRIIQYHPLKDHSGLFRIFADLELTQEAIKSFADRFGSLGGRDERMIGLKEPIAENDHHVGRGVSLEVWHTAIINMHQAVELWELARTGNSDELGKFIKWDEKRVSYESHPDLPPDRLPDPPFVVTSAEIAHEPFRQDVLTRFVPGDVILPAFSQVQSFVNKELQGKASPRILWDDKTNKFGVHFMPDGLLGALWLQFAQAMERDNEFRRCLECNTWFELSPQTARSNKTYCSNACRTKAYRERQAEAVRLHGEGLAVDEIARQLKADAKSVAGWVKKG